MTEAQKLAAWAEYERRQDAKRCKPAVIPASATARFEKFAPRCVDCGDAAWDTARMICKWCARWRTVDAGAAACS